MGLYSAVYISSERKAIHFLK